MSGSWINDLATHMAWQKTMQNGYSVNGLSGRSSNFQFATPRPLFSSFQFDRILSEQNAISPFISPVEDYRYLNHCYDPNMTSIWNAGMHFQTALPTKEKLEMSPSNSIIGKQGALDYQNYKKIDIGEKSKGGKNSLPKTGNKPFVRKRTESRISDATKSFLLHGEIEIILSALLHNVVKTSSLSHICNEKAKLKSSNLNWIGKLDVNSEKTSIASGIIKEIVDKASENNNKLCKIEDIWSDDLTRKNPVNQCLNSKSDQTSELMTSHFASNWDLQLMSDNSKVLKTELSTSETIQRFQERHENDVKKIVEDLIIEIFQEIKHKKYGITFRSTPAFNSNLDITDHKTRNRAQSESNEKTNNVIAIQCISRSDIITGPIESTDINDPANIKDAKDFSFKLRFQDAENDFDEPVEVDFAICSKKEKHNQSLVHISNGCDKSLSPNIKTNKTSMFYPKKSKSMAINIAARLKSKPIGFKAEFEKLKRAEERRTSLDKKYFESNMNEDLALTQQAETLRRRKTNNLPFISKNEAENRDILSEEWNILKALTSDQERINHAQKRFGNREPGNPCLCMSFHGYRRSRLASGRKDLIKLRAHNSSNEYTMLKHIKNIVKIKNGKIEVVENQPFQNQSRKRKNFDYGDLPNPKRAKLLPFDHYEDAMCKVLATYKMTNPPSDWIYILRHFKISMIETRTFLKFYLRKQTDEHGRLMMPLKYFEANVCMEMIFHQFIMYYGPNEIVRCKDCEFIDESSVTIMHPL